MTIIALTIASAAQRDYGWLKASVADWLHRTDLTAQIPDFVMLAEKRINDDLNARLQQMPVQLSVNLGDTVATVPSGLNTIYSLSLPTYGALEPMTPEKLETAYASHSPGIPRHYALVGDTLKLGPIPDGPYTFSLTYRADVPALSDSGDTNWLIAQHADIYLAASMCAALLYTQNIEQLQIWEGRYTSAIAALNNTDWNASGTLAIRSDTTTP
jgi:hypothetical protein